MLFGLVIWIPIGFIFGATLNGIIDCLIYAIISVLAASGANILNYIHVRKSTSKFIHFIKLTFC